MSDDELADKCKAEIAQWFGAEEVSSWQLLRIYRIPFAQPNQVQYLQQDALHHNADTVHLSSVGCSIRRWSH